MRTLFVLAALACMVVLPVCLFHLGRSRTTQVLGRLVSRVDTHERVVALTFDDGPSAATIDEILGTLAGRRVHATFFVIGSELARDPDLGHRLVADGHELGNHTYSHDHMILKSHAFIRREVEETDALIAAAGQPGTSFFRAPFCWKLVGLPWFLWRTGRVSVTWDVEPASDFDRSASSDLIATQVIDRVRPGSIVLLHVWYGGNTAAREALPAIVDGLHARGYRFVTMKELVSRPR